jgi:transporter family protein
MLVWAVATLFERRTSYRIGGEQTTLVVVIVGLLPIAIFYLYTLLTTPIPQIMSVYNGAFFWVAALSGVFDAVGFALWFKALHTEQVTNAESIVPVQYILVAVFGVLFLGEVVSSAQVAAGVLILVGVLLVSTQKKNPFRFNWALAPVFLANICWGIYWMLLSFSISHFGVASPPLLISRAFAAMFVFSFYSPILLKSIRKKKGALSRIHWKPILSLAVLAALLDGLGNMSFSVVSVMNGVAIASPILLLAIPTVMVLAVLFYKERLSLAQAVGLAVAFIGALAFLVF